MEKTLSGLWRALKNWADDFFTPGIKLTAELVEFAGKELKSLLPGTELLDLPPFTVDEVKLFLDSLFKELPDKKILFVLDNSSALQAREKNHKTF
ncbi:MAG: hypothetical protein J7M18_01700 [Candidatus Eremiobacteraeota bacterium]|nr:hypothetical protein [Candidatus Eremiobacteraeota bacterium]